MKRLVLACLLVACGSDDDPVAGPDAPLGTHDAPPAPDAPPARDAPAARDAPTAPIADAPPLTPLGDAATTGTPAYFATLPPGATLPSDATCAALVKHRPENKGDNATANATRGHQSLDANFMSGDDARANADLVPRVTGNFSGTTDEVLQWAACKWGVDEDMVRAQAAIESWWHQGTHGDFGTDASRCPPGHGLGVDGMAGKCPESYGVLQNRFPYEMSSWPGIGESTAFNADTAYAIWRACFEGYEGWLNTVERGKDYAAGDALGCMGRWFAGRWHTDAADGYAARVQGYLDQRIWETPNFQEP